MTDSEKSDHFLQDLAEPVNQFINVPIAALIVKVLKHTPVTPNQVTIVSTLFGILSGLAFSQGTLGFTMLAGLYLEIALVLDCADGQLARAKDCATEFGRLVDGVAGYISYLSVIAGIIIGLDGALIPTIIIAVITILKAITFDYCKQFLTILIQEGYDGNKREIHNTYKRITDGNSRGLIVYFYYLQFQQFIFRGKWSSFKKYANSSTTDAKLLLAPDQRREFYQRLKPLTVVWKWNGSDFVLFSISILAITGIIGMALDWMAYAITAQFFLTLIFHRRFFKNENFS